MPTLAEKQEEMKRRVRQQATPVVKENSLLPPQPAKEERKLCITGCGRWARLGQVYCSRCNAGDYVNTLRDTLPGLPTEQELTQHQEEILRVEAEHRGAELVYIQEGEDDENRNDNRVSSDNNPIIFTGNSVRREEEMIIGMDPAIQGSEETVYSFDGQKVYTRKQVARMLGVSSTTLCRWENKGKIPQPRRLMHSKQCLYTEEIVAAAKEYKNQEYIPPVNVSSAQSTVTGRLPFAIKKGMKVNRRLERAVANRIGTGRSTL
jgi:transcriptional regulator with XRE-family HTH domain